MAILHSPARSTREAGPLWGHERSRSAFGEVGLGVLLDRQMEDAWGRWAKPNGLLSGEHIEEPDEDFTYQSVKLPTVAKILVRFKKAEPLKPRHFSLDELNDDDE